MTQPNPTPHDPGQYPSGQNQPGQYQPGQYQPGQYQPSPYPAPYPPTTYSATSYHSTPYPVRLDARLDDRLSRWLWLVKWFLAIPHVFILILLWITVLPVTLIAGIAILITGRYPRTLFDLTVGVIRWSWRVGYYAFTGLGTDRYPPFSLDPDPTYPADFSVAYPERLSRGLVLVKWWLLAIPQYLIVGLLVGGGYGSQSGEGGGGGLIGLLVLFAVIVLLFTGAYPRPLFDLVIGLDRWSYRVLTYALLLRDEYPPFRLDQGGSDPASLMMPPPGTAPGGTGVPRDPGLPTDPGRTAL